MGKKKRQGKGKGKKNVIEKKNGKGMGKKKDSERRTNKERRREMGWEGDGDGEEEKIRRLMKKTPVRRFNGGYIVLTMQICSVVLSFPSSLSRPITRLQTLCLSSSISLLLFYPCRFHSDNSLFTLFLSLLYCLVSLSLIIEESYKYQHKRYFLPYCNEST